MDVSLNSIVGFNPTFQARCEHVPIYSYKISASRPSKSACTSLICGPIRINLKEGRSTVSCSASGSNTGTGDVGVDSLPSDSSEVNSQIPEIVDNSLGVKITEPNNGSSSNTQSTRKGAALTARERLRAARVLSRYTETSSKGSKPEMGSKLLDVLKENDKKTKKKPGLPEAPMNLFDDSKRGLPKQGLTIQLPGGADILIIAISFVFISTVMFTTTYVVWKLGAIHFNEY